MSFSAQHITFLWGSLDNIAFSDDKDIRFMTVRCVERLQIAFKDIYCEFYVRLETRAQWSIFPISFDFFWHEGGMMEHFCNEKVWSVDQKEHFIFWDFHDFIFYASPPQIWGGIGDDFRKATVYPDWIFTLCERVR